MDLNLVTAFIRVVEQQSFTAAAKALGLPKSSVSRRVTDLERSLGVQLLHRTTRKLALTEAGRAYFEQAERAIAELEAAAESAAGMDKEPRGIVRMTAPVDIGVMGLASIISEFTSLYPDIHVDLSLSSRVVNLVDDGFDLGVRAGKFQDVSLVTKRIGQASLGLFASPNYLARRGRPRELADLAKHDCVLFRAQNGKAVWKLDGANGQAATLEVRGRVNTDEMLFVRQAINSQLGIGLLPLFVLSECVEANRLAALERVLPDYVMSGADLSVITPSGPRRPRRVTLLRDFVVEKLTLRILPYPLEASATKPREPSLDLLKKPERRPAAARPRLDTAP